MQTYNLTFNQKYRIVGSWSESHDNSGNASDMRIFNTSCTGGLGNIQYPTLYLLSQFSATSGHSENGRNEKKDNKMEENMGLPKIGQTSAQNCAHPQVQIVNNAVTASTRDIAEFFGKEHRHVIAAVRNLKAHVGASAEFINKNIRRSYYLDSQGKHQPSYRLTRDGFVLLAMGFTGTRALDFKIAYIEAFNRMEAELAARRVPKYIPAPVSKSTEMELFLRIQDLFKNESDLSVARNKRDLLTNAIAHIINQKEFSQNLDRFLSENQRRQ